jgi:hypothetical protein
MIGISGREVGWIVWCPREWFTLLAERDRPDGRAHRCMFTHDVTGLNVSVRIEPALTCKTSEARREAYWHDRGPQLATAELPDRSERDGFAWLEFTGRRANELQEGRTLSRIQHLHGGAAGWGLGNLRGRSSPR